MRNNVRGLFIHLLITALIFGLSFIINLSPAVVKLLYGNRIFCVVAALLPLLLYYLFGGWLSKFQNPKLDFFAGNIIVLLGVVLGLFSLIGFTRPENADVAGTLFRLPMDMFLFAQIYSLKVLGLQAGHIALLGTSFVPGIIFGIRIKQDRGRISRHRRRRPREMRGRR
ncbi:hypothetical protein O6R05_02520 [Peptoniphilus equinus]|uniref:EamA domain-containing protein n=1 Tax=Peptoniphilus equinus TaxID=3016343 RepID=A0ABY7QUI4_9FIRM|nr:hypothetical protein [Peptoniphilus equinus]WBW50436.1 hypothetical protein O6R05_02520 [Peptoniphilus equinus]